MSLFSIAARRTNCDLVLMKCCLFFPMHLHKLDEYLHNQFIILKKISSTSPILETTQNFRSYKYTKYMPQTSWFYFQFHLIFNVNVILFFFNPIYSINIYTTNLTITIKTQQNNKILLQCRQWNRQKKNLIIYIQLTFILQI